MMIDCLDAWDKSVKFELPKDGRLTPQLRWVLMNGHCHSFALAIHCLTDWPMVAKIANGKIEHVLCQMPDGTLVDAEGVIENPKNLFRRHSGPVFRFLPPGFEFRTKDGWLDSVEDVLTPFAQTRLEELQENDEEFHLSEYPFWRVRKGNVDRSKMGITY